MKKLIILFAIFLPITLQSCKSVDNWSENPVLSSKVTSLSIEYINRHNSYIAYEMLSHNTQLDDNPTSDEFDNKLSIEKDVAVAYNSLIKSWFNLFIELQLDPNFLNAYNGHYYFRKAIESLDYINKIRSIIGDNPLNLIGKKHIEDLIILEEESRLFIAQQISYNESEIDIESNYKTLKKIYRDIK